jgi:hypothetical protein
MAVYEKLMAIQQELKAPKGQYNAFGKYSYRSCEDIVEAVKPLAGKVKAVLTITDRVELVGERYYIIATATLMDAETGEKISVTSQAREEDSKKGMDAAQVSGAASSYARKYALNGLFAIDDTKDSDAKDSDAKNSGAATQKPQRTSKMLCKDCGVEIRNAAKKDGSLWAAKDIATYSARRFGRALCPDCQRKAFASESTQ